MKSARKIRALRKGILLSCLFAVVLMIAVYESFLFGRALFSESAYGSSAVTVEVTVTEGESTLQVARMLEDNIGYISIDRFTDQTDEQFLDALEEMQEAGAESLIFDLRNNPGGQLAALVNSLDPLLP